MVSKLALFIQVLLVMVILIPSMGEARNLVEKQNGDAKSDCFWWWPWWPFIPGPPTTPKTPSPLKTPITPSPSESPKAPSSPILEVATKKNEVDSVKYCTKTSVEGNSDATSDCFIIPGVPGLPWWAWPFIPFPPTTPATPSPSAAPATPSPSASPATPDSPKSSPLR